MNKLEKGDYEPAGAKIAMWILLLTSAAVVITLACVIQG